MANSFYLSCMNTDLLEEKGAQPAKDLIKGVGSWPLLENTHVEDSKESFKWFEQVLRNKEHGGPAQSIHRITVLPDLKVGS